MLPDFATFSIEELRRYIDYHAKSLDEEKRGLALEARRHLDNRETKLDFEKTKASILFAARERRFLTYGDIAKANGKDWQSVRRLMPKHLGELLKYAAGKGWPMVTAIVVSERNEETGEMKPETLSGFINGVKRAGVSVPADHLDYLKKEQGRVFDWAAEAGENS